MSAAEPANPPHGAPEAAGGGDVIRLSDRAAARYRPESATGAYDKPSGAQQLTEHMEALFNARGRTLSDRDTAEAYGIALEGVLLMLDGALAEGMVGEEQHRQLHAMVEGMRSAPHLL